MELRFKLKDCYGIKTLNQSFSFDFKEASNCIQLIYAPNGTMKSSFARSLKKYSEDKKIEDGLDKQKVGICEIKNASTDFPKENIFVFDIEDNSYDASNNISTFLADKDTKRQYDETVKGLIDLKSGLLKKLKDVAKSSDIENELCEAFALMPDSSSDFFEATKVIKQELDLFQDSHPFVSSGYNFNDLFDKSGKVKEFVKLNKGILKDYYLTYKTLLQNSSFYHFSGSGNSFGPYQAQLLAQDLKDGRFFAAEHFLSLKGNMEIKNHKELEELLKQEQRTLDQNPELKKKFELVSKKIDKNAELRKLKDIFEKYPPIVDELINDYDGLKKKILLSYLKVVENQFNEFFVELKNKETEIEVLVKRAEEQKEVWEEILAIFNLRFHQPFEVTLENTKDVILKGNSAHLRFIYFDGSSKLDVRKEDLLNVLSCGEKRAFYILQLLFEIFSRQKIESGSKEQLIVLDDVVDSFDYQNKYAVIEYLEDLAEQQAREVSSERCDKNRLMFMVFTHNFDFYRNLANKVNLSSGKGGCHMWMANKNQGNISLKPGQYTKNFFEHILKNIGQNPKFLMASIPFLRNLSEYFKDINVFGDGLGFESLTCYLHIKIDDKKLNLTSKLNLSDLEKHISNSIKKEINCKLSGKTYLKDLKDSCHQILYKNNIENLPLIDKIVLSIGIRLLAEDNMLSSSPELVDKLKAITSNQTRELYKKWLELNKSKNKEMDFVFKRVFLFVNDNIHLNSFMLQPLIDAGSYDLKDIYEKLEKLLPENDFLGWRRL